MNKDKFYESSLKLLQPLSLNTTYKIVVNEAIKLVDGAGGSIVMAEKGIMRRRYSSDPAIKSIDPQRHGRTYKAYKEKKVITLTRDQIISVHPEFEKLKISSYLLVPLINTGRSIGVLSIYRDSAKFSPEEKRNLVQFSTLASMAIRKAQLYSELHDALSARDLFISMAAHELRTPVTTMYVYTQLLKKKTAKGQKFDPEWVNNLLYEMARLTRLIDELLQVNQMRSGNFKYEFEEIDLKKVLDKSVKSFKITHKNAEVILRKPNKKRVMIVGDPDKLTQVVTNLLDNSIKHNEWGKPIEVSLQTDGHFAKIRVTDSGTGISKEDRPHLFEEFYKGKGHTKAGMGLGLYLIKKIVNEHKGKIIIDSEIGKGTSVTVKLPIPEYD